jgi:hypothetical protein
MGRRLTEIKRRAILRDIREGQLSRNAVARKHEVAAGTVTKIAHSAGIFDAFDRSRTMRATEAAQIDAAAERARLRDLLLADAHRLRAMLWEPCRLHNFGGKDNTYNSVDLPEPDFKGKRELMTSVGIAVDKIVRLDAKDDGIEAAAGLISKLVGGLRDEAA